ncbi:hypothetical protein LC612_29340 [Nostoc sp. CHAB 5834]|nr:hypothetical protein [Nostoc sp. CHAB 5834]
MIKEETRKFMVTYCDCCRKEIVGNFVTFNRVGTEPLHACTDWSEEQEATCEAILSKKLVDEARQERLAAKAAA